MIKLKPNIATGEHLGRIAHDDDELLLVVGFAMMTDTRGYALK